MGRDRARTRVVPQFEFFVRSRTLYFVWYNFVKVHKTLRMSPAMAAGLTDKLWAIEDIVALVDAAEPKTSKRGPYKKRAA
jgi:hypothetical protein